MSVIVSTNILINTYRPKHKYGHMLLLNYKDNLVESWLSDNTGWQASTKLWIEIELCMAKDLPQ